MAFAQKDGASNTASPASLPEQRRVASNAAQVSDRRAMLRALFDVLGPCIVRFDDGGAAVLSAEALKIIPLHGVLNA